MLRVVSIFLAIALFSPAPQVFAQGLPGMPQGAPIAPMPNVYGGAGGAMRSLPSGGGAAPSSGPARLPPQITAAPAPGAAASTPEPEPQSRGWRNPKQTAAEFRSRCSASKGALVGGASYGFCLFN